jgi:peptide deformylase
MQTLDIVPFGHPALREVAKPVRVFHKKFHAFVDSLAATLAGSKNGAALAAPQVAELRRVVVMNYLKERLELVNPRVVAAEGEEDGFEGCLSFSGHFGLVKRAAKVTVTYQDRRGDEHTVTREGKIARCLQHEIDHLDGILYIDRMVEPFVTNDATERKIDLAKILKLAGPPKQPVIPLHTGGLPPVKAHAGIARSVSRSRR